MTTFSNRDIAQWKKILQKSNNQITQYLLNLKKLSLKKITSIPNSIKNLIQLEELCLSVNTKTINSNIYQLNNLKKLTLWECNNIESLSKSIGKLTQLKCLNLYECNNLHILPKNIGNLKNLEYLHIQYKNIHKLPLSFSKLNNLKDTYLCKVLSKIDEIQSKNQKEKLLDILLCVLKMREELIVYDFYQANELVFNIEKVSHYTTSDTLIKLLGRKKLVYSYQKDMSILNMPDEKYNNQQVILKEQQAVNNNEEQEPSPLRMYGSNQLNDPSEGKLIYDFFNNLYTLKNKNIHLQPVSELATCLTSFSLNQDSLNQFRLYGKENGKEATGISIGLKADFFDYCHHLFNETNDEENKKLPLYRCIYLEPKGKLNGKPYIKVASCDKSMFYKKENLNDNDLKNYCIYIEKIEKTVTDLFVEIETNIDILFSSITKNEEELIINAINFILLPLSFMIKHIAYQEEEECRIFCFSTFDNDKIIIEDKKMYINYLAINDYVSELYLAPGAKKHQDIFKVLTQHHKNNVEVNLSDNPFRTN